MLPRLSVTSHRQAATKRMVVCCGCIGLSLLAIVWFGVHPRLQAAENILPDRQVFAAPANIHPKLAVSHGKLPLSFEANQGQTDARLQFLARGGSYTTFIADDETDLTLRKSSPDVSGLSKLGPFGPVDPRPGGWLAASLASPANADAQASALPESAAGQGAMVTLRGNTRPEAKPINDRGRVSDDLAIHHMMLQLQRTPEREEALQQFIKDIHDPASPLFHHWITAAEFGQKYGVAPADVARVTDWLESQGFKVNLVYPNQMVIDFTGSAGHIRQAFHTEIHNLLVKGQGHIANMSDPQIPASLASTVAGVVSLNDFRPQRMLQPRGNYTAGSGDYPVVPADLWTIYNFNPAFAQGFSGQGQTIVVLEDSDLYTTADWNTFRSTLGLASAYPGGSLIQVNPPSSPANNCIDPGANNNDDEVAVDVEWASAAAPSATIELASCLDTTTGFGGFIAFQNLLNASGTPPAVVSISYGESESVLGASYNAYISSLYQQGVAEGVSVFVSSGDSGPASSDQGSIYAQYGINVSGFTSTPYNVSVGGTDFADTYQGNTAAYWNPVNAANYGSALSYIPEIPWNDSCASVLLADWERMLPTYGSTGLCSQAGNVNQGEFLNTVAGGGGPSGCATGVSALAVVVGGTCAGYAKPLWQSGLLGNPSDGVRDIPDVSLLAANGIWGHYYVACFSDPNNGGKSCSGAPGTWSGFGGTSISAPIMAGIQSLVNQASGSRWGNPNPAYYALAATEYGSGGSATCNSALGSQVASDCIFNDVTQIPLLYAGTGAGGDIDLPCGWINCYLPSGAHGVLSTAPQTVNYLQIVDLGSGYTSAPACTISGGGGSGAACSAIVTGVVNSLTLTNGGSGYTSYPTCTLTGGGGTGATCGVGLTTTSSGAGWVSSVGLITYGSGYTSAPTCTISGGGGTGATCTATVASGVEISLTAGGSGYTTVPGCAISGGGGTGATCMALEVTSSNAYQPAYTAGTGWDFATGIGTVNASNLVTSFLSFSASLSPSSLVFSPQLPFTTSSAQNVTMTNTGTAQLAILAVTVGGTNPSDFAKSADTCTGATVMPNGTCTVSVTFTPTYAGNRSASLNFTDAARQSQNTITLSGMGVGAGVSLSPPSLTFPDQILGTSAAQTVTLTNPGSMPLSLGSIVITGNNPGDFAQTNTCGSTLGVGANCAINVTFTPAAPGSRSAALTISDSALDSPQTVSLTGTGAMPLPFINQPLVPTSVAPGGSGFTLTVTGTGFASGATVNWNGVPLATSYVGTQKLTATVPAANIASPGTVQVTVVNPGSALVSNVILFSVTPPVPDVTFANAHGSPIAVGTDPAPIAVGDFNGDGKMDLAVANVVSGGVTILLSKGDGTFTPAASLAPTGLFPGSIAVGDFNGDGKLDLVTSNSASENLTILLGNGDGTFTPAAESPATAIMPEGVAVGDFNGDGKLDLAVANPNSNGITVLLGNGDGTFAPGVAYPATGNGPTVIAVGDFNGDGRLDLAAVNQHSNSVTILLGNGDGTFSSAAESPATGATPYAIAVGDLNGDGKLDLAIVNADGDNVTILLGNGDGTFTAAPSPATGSGPVGIALGDLNGDGILDLAIANLMDGNVTILLGNGDGTFTASASSPATDLYPAQIAVGDFNGDGRLDLATPNEGTNDVSVLLSLAPLAAVSPGSLTFGTQNVGTTSASQPVTLNNTGTAALTIPGIATSANFGQFNNCGSSVAASGSCTINVTFSPSATGPLTGTLTITDNNGVAGSRQTVALSGTGQDFMLAAPSGSSTSASVAAGQSATYTLSVAGEEGLSGAVTFTCAGAPSEATCTVSPNPVTVGSSAANVTVSVTTTAASVSAPRSRPFPRVPPLLPGGSNLLMLAVVLAALAWAARDWRQPRLRAVFVPLAAGLLLALVIAGCGGGGGGGGGTSNAGTPAGTYTLTVTGSTGSGSSTLRHSVTLTLTVS